MAGRVVITGATGFLGSHLREVLAAKGYDVRGIGRLGGSGGVVGADLSSSKETAAAFASLEPYRAVIHLAGLAHGGERGCFKTNLRLTKNVVAATRPRDPHFVFFSSVAVYGEEGRTEPVRVGDVERPASEYGKSKLAGERAVREARFSRYHLLRPAPVFDADHLNNLKKRVYWPGQSRVKMRIVPSPAYSLCGAETMRRSIACILERPEQIPTVAHIADSTPYRQVDLLGWFPGPSIPLPARLSSPLLALARLIPGAGGYAARCAIWKLLHSNVYEVASLDQELPISDR